MRLSKLIPWSLATVATAVAAWLAMGREEPPAENLTKDLLAAQSKVLSLESKLQATEQAKASLEAKALNFDTELASIKARNSELLQAQRRAQADSEIALRSLEVAHRDAGVQLDEINRLKRELMSEKLDEPSPEVETSTLDSSAMERLRMKAKLTESAAQGLDLSANGTTSADSESTETVPEALLDVSVLSIASDETAFAISAGLDKGLAVGRYVDLWRGTSRLGRAIIGQARTDFAVVRPLPGESFAHLLSSGETLTITIVQP